MKKIYLIAAATLWALNSLAAAASFEGVVRYKILGQEAGEGHSMEFSIKGEKFRMESAANGFSGATIMDMKTKQAITLMPSRKTYMVTKLDHYPKPKSSRPIGKLIKTDKTETIAGYPAEEWTYAGDDSKVSLWGNKELGAWAFSDNDQSSHVEIPAEFKKGGFFLLRMSSKKGGMEATKVEKKSLPDSLFEIPSGYTKMASAGTGMPGAGLRGLSPEQKKAMMDSMKNMTPEQKAMMEKIMHGKDNN